MPDPATGERYSRHEGGKPNFGLVVLIATVALLVVFVGAWLLVRSYGSHMLAPTHPNPQPHAALRLPGRSVRAA